MLNTYICHHLPPTCFRVWYAIFRGTIAVFAQKLYAFLQYYYQHCKKNSFRGSYNIANSIWVLSKLQQHCKKFIVFQQVTTLQKYIVFEQITTLQKRMVFEEVTALQKYLVFEQIATLQKMYDF
jgi:hypothetical protein